MPKRTAAQKRKRKEDDVQQPAAEEEAAAPTDRRKRTAAQKRKRKEDDVQQQPAAEEEAVDAPTQPAKKRRRGTLNLAEKTDKKAARRFVFVCGMADGIQKIFKEQITRLAHTPDVTVKVDWTSRTAWLQCADKEASEAAAERLKRVGRVFGHPVEVGGPDDDNWVSVSGLNGDMGAVWESILRSRFLGTPGFQKAFVDWNRRLARLRFADEKAATKFCQAFESAKDQSVFGKKLVLAQTDGYDTEVQVNGFSSIPKEAAVAEMASAFGAVLRVSAASRGAHKCVILYAERASATKAVDGIQGKTWDGGAQLTASILEHKDKRGAQYRRRRERAGVKE
eukprot:TRINITY_DN4249_c1_g1_i1.p1 TRINITY_DN4249_c1_g1~~TRINITY_DN4249_c1_g1_i1.p1  ORF type:complete len:374 (+),score=68.89 TRINITY_DN4249_c1_g1_i1:111-1124(+)